MHKRFRQWLLVTCLAFTVLGVQVIAESPLHEHSTSHAVDCGLCHVASSAAVPDSSHPLPVFGKVRSVYHATVKQFNASQTWPDFLSRGPPANLT